MGCGVVLKHTIPSHNHKIVGKPECTGEGTGACFFHAVKQGLKIRGRKTGRAVLHQQKLHQTCHKNKILSWEDSVPFPKDPDEFVGVNYLVICNNQLCNPEISSPPTGHRVPPDCPSIAAAPLGSILRQNALAGVSRASQSRDMWGLAGGDPSSGIDSVLAAPITDFAAGRITSILGTRPIREPACRRRAGTRGPYSPGSMPKMYGKWGPYPGSDRCPIGHP